MIFSRLENIELEKRTSLSVGSSGFISLNPLKTDFYFSSVSDVLMIKNPDESRFPLVHLRYYDVRLRYCSGNIRYRYVHLRYCFGYVRYCNVNVRFRFVNIRYHDVNARYGDVNTRYCFGNVRYRDVNFRYCDVNGTSGTTNDYTYDLNGNMISDKNKNITSIKYNYLNLPTMINFLSGDFIEYKYNAGGQKISKFVSSVNTNNTVKLVEYLDGFQYTGEELNFFPHAEGYVNVTLGTTGNRIFNYVYNYTDHLGNIRLSYTKDVVNNQLKILEENNYYPFGLKHQKYSSAGSIGLKAIDEVTARPASLTSTPYAYKYNGKEFQDELGLNMYDMDMRQYDPAIARWVVLDPVIHHSMSPYNAFDNNPVFWADPSGADSVFDNLGTEVASITNMSTGFSIGAGGAGDNGGDNDKNPRTLGKGGKSSSKETKKEGKVVNEGITSMTEDGGNVYTTEGCCQKQVNAMVNILRDMVTAPPAISSVRMLYGMITGKELFPGAPDSQVDMTLYWGGTIGAALAEPGPGGEANLAKNTLGKTLNRLNHIFGKSDHALGGLVKQFGSEQAAFDAVQNSANQALKAGNLTPDAKGVLPSGNAGNIINVGGTNVRLIGGRVSEGKVIISSFSRLGL